MKKQMVFGIAVLFFLVTSLAFAQSDPGVDLNVCAPPAHLLGQMSPSVAVTDNALSGVLNPAGLAAREGVTAAQLVFAFSSQIGMLPLTGTTSKSHMREDLDGVGKRLSKEDMAMIEAIAVQM